MAASGWGVAHRRCSFVRRVEFRQRRRRPPATSTRVAACGGGEFVCKLGPHSAQSFRRQRRMEPKLTFRYDREADILYIDKVAAYAAQDSEELSDGVVARLHPETEAIENLEVLYFSTRLLRSELLELPID